MAQHDESCYYCQRFAQEIAYSSAALELMIMIIYILNKETL